MLMPEKMPAFFYFSIFPEVLQTSVKKSEFFVIIEGFHFNS